MTPYSHGREPRTSICPTPGRLLCERVAPQSAFTIRVSGSIRLLRCAKRAHHGMSFRIDDDDASRRVNGCVVCEGCESRACTRGVERGRSERREAEDKTVRTTTTTAMETMRRWTDDGRDDSDERQKARETTSCELDAGDERGEAGGERRRNWRKPNNDAVHSDANKLIYMWEKGATGKHEP